MINLHYHMNNMIARIRDYGLNNERIFSAMRDTPRHLFAPQGTSTRDAYGDYPIPIGTEQTISQPYTVAYMLDLLDIHPSHRVLEVGTGSGWNAALLRRLVGDSGRVTSIECVPALAYTARALLEKLKIKVEVICTDGSRGHEENSPYDRIIVTCAAPHIYDAWMRQLAPEGIIIAPVGIYAQEMIRVISSQGQVTTTTHGGFRFVPLKTGE